MRVLVITKIFPNAAEPTAAAFNRQQIAELSRLCEVEVLATIPWFPGAGSFGRRSSAGRLTSVPKRERIEGIDVAHPRTLFVPRMAHGSWAALYAASLVPAIVRRRGRFDVVLGTWAYPDGVASIALARLLGVPAVVKLHGSDMNVIAKMPGPRRQLSLALPRAARVVAVSRALADEARSLGVSEDRIAIVMNGVDADLFHPRDRKEARRALGLPLDARIITYVGNLKESKGVLDLLAAFGRVEDHDIRLAIVGGGEARAEVERAAAPFGDRVVLAGPQPLAEIPKWIGACDVLTLPSWNEGTPNVVLEALASGRRVVATRVGGIPDLVTSPELGELVAARDVASLAAALVRAARAPYDPKDVAHRGARGSWSESARELANVLREAKDGRME